MLTRFFTQLWKLSDLTRRRAAREEILTELGIRPYFLEQYLEFQNNFSQQQIEHGFRALLEADVTLKSSSRAPHLVLELLTYALVKGTADPMVA